MRDLRIEIVDEGAGIYIAVDPDGVWGRSTEVDETITVDWDQQGRLIGVELAGRVASDVSAALGEALRRSEVSNRDALGEVLTAIGLPGQQPSTRTRAVSGKPASVTHVVSKRATAKPHPVSRSRKR